jgi:hypothetical protein
MLTPAALGLPIAYQSANLISLDEVAFWHFSDDLMVAN